MKISVQIDSNNIVKGYGSCLTDTHDPFQNGTIIDTDLDLDSIDVVNNFKLVNGALVKFLESEKSIIIVEPTIEECIVSTEAAILTLMEML